MPGPHLRIVARFPAPGRRSRFVLGSLVAHGACVSALALAPLFGRGPRIPDHAVVVELVSSLAGPQAATARKAAERAPAPPKPAPAPQRVESRKPEPPKPKKDAEKPQAKPKAEPTPARPPTPAPGPTSPDLGPAGPPLAPGGSSVTALETGGAELAWYRSAVTAALHTHWQRPLLDGTREPIEVAVAFEIHRDGSVGDVRIDRESGVPSLDRSALRAVSDSAPLPPLPPDWREPALTALYVFRYYPE